MNYRTLYDKGQLRIFLARGKGSARKRVECLFNSEDNYSIVIFVVRFNDVVYSIYENLQKELIIKPTHGF